MTTTEATPTRSRGPAAPHARTDPRMIPTEIPSGPIHRFQRFVDEPADKPGTDIRFLYPFHFSANMRATRPGEPRTVEFIIRNVGEPARVRTFTEDDIDFESPYLLDWSLGTYPVILEILRQYIVPGQPVILNIEQGDRATRYHTAENTYEVGLRTAVATHAGRLVRAVRDLGAIPLGVYGANLFQNQLQADWSDADTADAIIGYRLIGEPEMILAGIEGVFDLRKRDRILEIMRSLDQVAHAVEGPMGHPVPTLVVRPQYRVDSGPAMFWEPLDSWRNTLRAIDNARRSTEFRRPVRVLPWADGSRAIPWTHAEPYLEAAIEIAGGE